MMRLFLKPLKTSPEKKTFTIFLCVIAFFGGSCSRWSFGETGPITTQFRTIDSCHSLKIGQKFDVILLCDTLKPMGYSIEYPEKLIPHIEHSIKNGILEIHDNNQGKWTQDLSQRPKVTLNLPRYQDLYIDGSSAWKCQDTLTGRQIQIIMNGSLNHEIWVHCRELIGKCQNIGALTLKGIGTIFSFTIESGGQLNAKELSCHDAYIWHFTQRPSWCSPERQAFLRLYNSGNLMVKPQDFYRKEVSELGKGRVIFEP